MRIYLKSQNTINIRITFIPTIMKLKHFLMFVAAFALHLAMFAQGGKAGIKNPLPKSTIDVSKTYFIQGKSSGLVLDV